MIPSNLPEASKQTKKMLSIFTNKNTPKSKENKSSNLFDDPKLFEESRKDFAAEYLAKYGDADIERRAVPIENFSSSDSDTETVGINQMDFNPDIFSKEYNCDKFNTILENYNKNKNDIDKIKLKTLLNYPDCREIDTIGKNKNDPVNWIIPDGQFRSLLNELEILEPYNANIQNIIKKRYKAKTMAYRMLKSTIGVEGGKTKRKRRNRRSTKRKTNKRRKKSRKNKV
jgi:hypothetical protein